MNDSPALAFHDVWRSFGDHDVLRGLNFSVPRGEVYALLGRNGVGKTTAIRVLLGALQADAGRSEVLGADSSALSPALRDRIGWVGEGQTLYPWMTVNEVLQFEQGTRRSFDLSHAQSVVQRLGLRESQKVDALSRGARTQLALTVAVATCPDVLILDDPAMGLDAVVRRELLESMIDAIGDSGCAVLFSSHILADVERVADRVGLLHEGHLLVDATVDDLKRRVQRRRVRTRDAQPPAVPGLLASRQVSQGFDLTLLDHDATRQAALESAVEALSPPETLSLEELFIELVGPDRRATGDHTS